MKVTHVKPESWIDTSEEGVIQPSGVAGLVHEVVLEEGDLMQGPQGVPGVKGDTGTAGPQGVPGAKGDTGAAGAQGAAGVKGDTGEAGPQGAPGAKGDTGAVGPKGVPGAKGDTGAVGPQGVQGPSVAGMVAYFAMSGAPAGWLVCDGSLRSRAAFAALFAAIGTIYGAGDGVSTFALPDLRGEFVRGLDGGRGVDAGRVLGSFQAQAVKDHVHGFSYVRNLTRVTVSKNSGYTAALAAGSSVEGVTDAPIPTATETRPRNIALLPCIATGA